MSDMMQIIDWSKSDPQARRQALARPRLESQADIEQLARAIIREVREKGDAALLAYAERFDNARLDSLLVTPQEFEAAQQRLDARQIAAIETAIDNVRRFHAAQLAAPLSMDVMPGVRCERVYRPIPAVGLYVPAGSAPLPSTVIMVAIPAQLAGCPERVLCTPPAADGSANAAVLVAARRCGVDRVFKAGGAQAVAAMAYGTESIPKVDKIFGPGTALTTAAKQLVAGDPQGAACDLPAGPSEVLVIADAGADPAFVAADLLAQAEHDVRAQSLLVTDSPELADAVTLRVRQAARQAVAPGNPGTVGRQLPDHPGAGPGRGAACLQPVRARTSDHPDARTARAARCGKQRGVGIPGRLVAGINGRLLLRNQPRTANLRLCPRLQRPFAHGLPEARNGPGAHRPRTAYPGPGGRNTRRSGRLDAHARAVSIRLEALDRQS